MARLPRLTVPGYAHHIIQRGNNRQAIFAATVDYETLLGLLDEFSRKFRVSLHAYVLMSNHIHLLATPEDAEGVYSNIFKLISNRYLVGYYPSNQVRDRKLREVKVEVRNHPEYIVTGRKDYFPQ